MLGSTPFTSAALGWPMRRRACQTSGCLRSPKWCNSLVTLQTPLTFQQLSMRILDLAERRMWRGQFVNSSELVSRVVTLKIRNFRNAVGISLGKILSTWTKWLGKSGLHWERGAIQISYSSPGQTGAAWKASIVQSRG